MKAKCEMIKDILPLYVDHTCSAESRQLVDEHLDTCPDCKHTAAQMAQNIFPTERQTDVPPRDIKAVKLLKKMRRRWFQSLVAILLLLWLIIPLFRMCVNQVKKEGRNFSNLDEIKTVERIFKHLSKGEYEQAFDYFDIAAIYQNDLAAFEGDDTYYHTLKYDQDEYTLTAIGDEAYYMNEETVSASALSAYDLRKTDPDAGDEVNFWYHIYLTGQYVMPEKTLNKVLSYYQVTDYSTKVNTPYGVFCVGSSTMINSSEFDFRSASIYDYLEETVSNTLNSKALSSRWYTADKLYWISPAAFVSMMDTCGIIPRTVLDDYQDLLEKIITKQKDIASYYKKIGLKRYSQIAKKLFVSRMIHLDTMYSYGEITFKDAIYISSPKIGNTDEVLDVRYWLMDFALESQYANTPSVHFKFQVWDGKIVTFGGDDNGDPLGDKLLSAFLNVGSFLPQE